MIQIERQVQVSYRHRVLFTKGVFEASNPVLRDILLEGFKSDPVKVLVIADDGLVRAYPELSGQIHRYFDQYSDIDLVCPAIIAEGGERVKNSYFHVSEIQSPIDRYHIDRHSYVIAIGGGALLDMVGLASATAHRGVRHIRIPTTTLSQADSGVGVKNGINAFGKKNFVGTFAPPFAVVNDLAWLRGLSERDKRGGYSEAVKVALIRDQAFFEELEESAEKLASFDDESMERLIYKCAELHVNHIASSGDPFEFGSARPLDFGHWAAHKLEQLSSYSIRHGEAVAIGICLDVIYSGLVGMLQEAEVDRVLNLIEKLGFELYSNELHYTTSEGNYTVLKGLEEFREHLGGELTVTLLEGIGKGTEVHEINLPKMNQAMHILRDRFQSDSAKIVLAHP
ncbi:MAG TPA: 3-dehydroquinate synthase [Verrucomicrobiales bacterium]|nr:3-dehydroquinate synthase [Verrucomicrobiales bacterium]HBP56584.1 3-dehydroquinate synthase [Verrucomicrobiales bacterium]